VADYHRGCHLLLITVGRQREGQMLRNLLTAIGVSICAWLLSSASVAEVIDTANPASEPVFRPGNSIDASASGMLTTRLPIVLPEARGPIPSISLSYNSGSANGLIEAITQRVSPRVFRVVALPVPSDREKSQLFMQRYIQQFP
jgi:hypothetical protein